MTFLDRFENDEEFMRNYMRIMRGDQAHAQLLAFFEHYRAEIEELGITVEDATKALVRKWPDIEQRIGHFRVRDISRPEGPPTAESIVDNLLS